MLSQKYAIRNHKLCDHKLQIMFNYAILILHTKWSIKVWNLMLLIFRKLVLLQAPSGSHPDSNGWPRLLLFYDKYNMEDCLEYGNPCCNFGPFTYGNPYGEVQNCTWKSSLFAPTLLRMCRAWTWASIAATLYTYNLLIEFVLLVTQYSWITFEIVVAEIHEPEAEVYITRLSYIWH